MKDDSRLGAQFTMGIFKLNGQMLGAGERMAAAAGLTVARWQVLGAVLRQPGTVSDIARSMGITRQSVQRVANRLIEEGLLERSPNPAHIRAPLLSPTEAGRHAVTQIAPGQTAFSTRLAEAFGRERLQKLADELEEMSAIVDRTSP